MSGHGFRRAIRNRREAIDLAETLRPGSVLHVYYNWKDDKMTHKSIGVLDRFRNHEADYFTYMIWNDLKYDGISLHRHYLGQFATHLILSEDGVPELVMVYCYERMWSTLRNVAEEMHLFQAVVNLEMFK